MIYLLRAEEDDWEFNRRQVLGYSTSEEDLKKYVQRYEEVRTQCIALNEEFAKIKDMVEEETPIVPQPNFIPKPPLYGNPNLTQHQQEQRAIINRKNDKFREEYGVKYAKRGQEVLDKTFELFECPKELLPVFQTLHIHRNFYKIPYTISGLEPLVFDEKGGGLGNHDFFNTELMLNIIPIQEL